MYKFLVSIKKEGILMLSDKLGMVVMFVMPLLLVFIITIIQDSAYKVINENKFSMIVSNQDEGVLGDELIASLSKSGFFDLEFNHYLDTLKLQKNLIKDDVLSALYIPNGFSEIVQKKAQYISGMMMYELGVFEFKESEILDPPIIYFYTDPVIQDSFSKSVSRMIFSHLGALENKSMIHSIYELMGKQPGESQLTESLSSHKSKIIAGAASFSNRTALPNSTQHNVPAWTLFAMFFMVVSLGTNVVKERLNGSFMRLKTMPSSFSIVLFSKMLVYVVIGILQVGLIFGISMLTFPYLGLPQLVLPYELVPLLIMVLLSTSAAVSFSLAVGTLSSTVEQCTGVGAVSVIIFGAIGGIWVPVFVMPDYMQQIAKISPLHWCLEGFYVLFLKGGSWNELFSIIVFILAFIFVCLGITLGRLKADKLL